MSRPFMLYHWSPASRRKSILKLGLCPNKLSRSGEWKPPYICFSRYPSVAWALSATHSMERGMWDLWCVWSDRIGKYKTHSCADNPRKQWWLTEYRSFQRIKKIRIWHVGRQWRQPRKSGNR